MSLHAGWNRAWADAGFFAVSLVYCTNRYGDRLFYRYGRAGSACPDPSGRGDDIGCDSGKGNEHKLSAGVAISLGLAMVRVLTGLSILWFLVPGYAAAIAMSFFVPNVHGDSHLTPVVWHPGR